MKTCISFLRRFYHGIAYPILVALLILVGHTSGLDLLFCAFLVATVFVGCLVASDLRFAIAPFTCFIFQVTPEHTPNVPSYSNYYATSGPLAVLVVLAIILIVGVVIFCIRNRRRCHRPRLCGFFPGLAALSLAICLNGVGNAAYTWENLLYALSYPLILLGFWLLFSSYLHFDRTTRNYFMFCLVLAGTLILCQLLLGYVTDFRFENGAPVKESVVLGWGTWAAIGGMLSILMPSCFYFAATHRYGWIFYLLGLLQTLGILLSQSRGALLVGGVILLFCLIIVCFFGRNRRINRILTASLVLVGVIGVVLLREKLFGLMENFLQYGFGDNGRFDLWRTGWERFLSHPIFGAGFYDSGIVQDWVIEVYPYFYHNTLIQMLGASGAFGFLAYLYHRFQTAKKVFCRPSLYKTFLGLSILSLIAFGMLDVLFFITYPLIFYVMILLFLDTANRRRED